MRRIYVLPLLLAAWLPLAIGCGGSGPTQASMRRHALRRAVDDEDLAAPADDHADQPAPADDRADRPADSPRQETIRTASRDSKPKQPPAKKPAASPPEADPPAGSPNPADPPGEPLGPAAPTPPPHTERPTEPLDVTQRRQRTIDNLTRIGEALKRYTETNGRLFAPCINDSLERPLLSWRVELLPYLGYQDLYDQFHLHEPWNSSHNQTLLTRIPGVYQSPERFDDRTNYLLPIASFTPFFGPRGLGLRRIEDGLPNTVIVLEVDDSAAVPWTRPDDLALNGRDFDQRVGELREDGFFAVWGDGSVTCVLRDCQSPDRHAIFTHDSGDSFASSLAKAPAVAMPAADASATTQSGSESRSPAGSGDRIAEAERAPGFRTPPASPGDQATLKRWPVPDAARLEQARALVREIYQGEYEKKRSPRDQQALARHMLQQASQMREDPAGQYVLLDIARKIAAQIGDSVTAWSALEQLLAHFDRNALAEQHELLNQVAKKERTETGVRLVLEQSTALVETALRREEFDTAESLCQIATGAARQLGDLAALRELDATVGRVRQARKTHREIVRTLASLTDADDPQTNLLLGRYFCLVKGDWDQGLVLLSRGADKRLKELAEAELSNPTIAQSQLDLAEGWWNLGTEDPTHQKSFHSRAGYWYARAAPRLPTGLWRTKVQLRLNELKQRYGEAAVPEPISPASHRGG